MRGEKDRLKVAVFLYDKYQRRNGKDIAYVSAVMARGDVFVVRHREFVI